MLCKKNNCESRFNEKKEKEFEYKVKEESLIIPNSTISSDNYEVEEKIYD